MASHGGHNKSKNMSNASRHLNMSFVPHPDLIFSANTAYKVNSTLIEWVHLHKQRPVAPTPLGTHGHVPPTFES